MAKSRITPVHPGIYLKELLEEMGPISIPPGSRYWRTGNAY